MSLNLISILLSLAMMLTGVGGEGQPVQASRVATLRNIMVTYNGEPVRLAPEAHLGVSADGESALFDFGVDLDGDTLMPVQVGVNGDGVTALFAGSGEAVTVTAGALEALVAQIAPTATDMQGESAELMRFITEEYLPAYGKLLGMAADREAMNEIQKESQAAFDKIVDRGEGTPDTVEIEGESYDVTAYTYTIESAQMAELVDAVYAANEALNAYYEAVFKLFAMMPEESGLGGIDSFAAMFDRMGIDVKMDVEERQSDDGEIDMMDAVMTIDISGAVALGTAAQAVDAAEETPLQEAASGESMPETEAVEIEPIVMNIHSEKVGDFIDSEIALDYDYNESQGIRLSLKSTQESNATNLDLDITALENGVRTMRTKAEIFITGDEAGNGSYTASVRNVVQDVSRIEMSAYGTSAPDGTSENSFAFGLRNADANVEVSFDLDVTAEAIADATTGREAAIVIDDLSGEALQAQMSDPNAVALMMNIGGSLSADAARLTGDKGVSRLITLMSGGSLPIDVDDIEDEPYDVTYEVEGDDFDLSYLMEDDDFTYSFDGDDTDIAVDDVPVEDDGVLGFPEPILGWLPDGWSVSDTAKDTAYDWMEMSLTDENGEESAYAIFFADPEADTANYIVQEDGKVVEGRGINVTDFGESGLSVTVQEGGVYGNIMFYSSAIDVETIGRVVAGIEF